MSITSLGVIRNKAKDVRVVSSISQIRGLFEGYAMSSGSYLGTSCQSVVNNGNFESGSGSAIAPWIGDSSTFSLNSNSHSGSNSARVTMNGTGYGGVYQTLLTLNKPYQLNYWAKAATSAVFTSAGPINGYDSNPFSVNANWNDQSYVFTRTNAADLGVALYLINWVPGNNPVGTVGYIDDVNLIPLDRSDGAFTTARIGSGCESLAAATDKDLQNIGKLAVDINSMVGSASTDGLEILSMNNSYMASAKLLSGKYVCTDSSGKIYQGTVDPMGTSNTNYYNATTGVTACP